MADLVSVRTGAFSGTAQSLLDSLRSKGVDVCDVDLISHARSPRLAPARIAGWFEARRYERVPWSKTAAWASANQRLVERATPVDAHPVLMIQTQSAFLPRTPYVVYTDRVAAEGTALADVFRRPGSPAWLARERELLRRASAVLVMGPTSARVLTDQYGLDPDRVEVVGAAPNARPAPRAPRSNPHRLLFVGTNWPLKGGPILIEAFGRLRQRRPDARLTIVGCRPAGAAPPGVQLRGRLSRHELRDAFAVADVFVLPTRSEAFGIAYVEALQSGLPCVGTDIANVPWIIGDAGLCVPPDDAEALCRALEDILANYERWSTLARRRGAWLEDNWSWADIAQKVIGRLQLDRQPA